jgi:hypothetical protein
LEYRYITYFCVYQTIIRNFQVKEVVLFLFINHMFEHLNGQLLCSQWPGISVQWLFELYRFLRERERERDMKVHTDSKQAPHTSQITQKGYLWAICDWQEVMPAVNKVRDAACHCHIWVAVTSQETHTRLTWIIIHTDTAAHNSNCVWM